MSVAIDLNASRLHAVVGASFRLRDELLVTLTAGWSGARRTLIEPDDMQRVVLDLDTPSLFEPPALILVRSSAAHLRRHRELLAPLIGAPAAGGVLMLSIDALDGREAFAKALSKAKALHEVDAPDGKQLPDWLAQHCSRLQQGVEQPAAVAAALIAAIGEDIDALLGAIDVLGLYAAGRRITAADVGALFRGIAAKPLWEFSGACLDGDARRALNQLDASDDPQAGLAMLISELRKAIACDETTSDADAATRAGLRGRPNLYYPRQRARQLGRSLLLRLLAGAIQAQRQLRQSGTDAALTVSLFVLHAQRLIRPRRG